MKRILLFLTICSVLVSIWFEPRKLLAHAEDGIPFYNLYRTSLIYSSVWNDSNLGAVTPFYISAYPFYKFASWLNLLVKSEVKVQKIVFLVLVFTPLIFVPLLSKTLFPNSSNLMYISAGLFYLFNLFIANLE